MGRNIASLFFVCLLLEGCGVQSGLLSSEGSRHRFRDGVYYASENRLEGAATLEKSQENASRLVAATRNSGIYKTQVDTAYYFGDYGRNKNNFNINFGLSFGFGPGWGWNWYWDPWYCDRWWCGPGWYRPYGPWWPYDPWYRPWGPYRPYGPWYPGGGWVVWEKTRPGIDSYTAARHGNAGTPSGGTSMYGGRMRASSGTVRGRSAGGDYFGSSASSYSGFSGAQSSERVIQNSRYNGGSSRSGASSSSYKGSSRTSKGVSAATSGSYSGGSGNVISYGSSGSTSGRGYSSGNSSRSSSSSYSGGGGGYSGGSGGGGGSHGGGGGGHGGRH